MNSRKSDNNKNKLLYDPNQANLRRLGAFSSVQNYDENEIDDVRDEELENNDFEEKNITDNSSPSSSALDDAKELGKGQAKSTVSNAAKQVGKQVAAKGKAVASALGKKLIAFIAANPWVLAILAVVIVIFLIILLIAGGGSNGNGYYSQECNFNASTVSLTTCGESTSATTLDLKSYVLGTTYSLANQKELNDEALKALMIIVKTNALSYGGYNNNSKLLTLNTCNFTYEKLDTDNEKYEKYNSLYSDIENYLFLSASYNSTIDSLNSSNSLNLMQEQFDFLENTTDSFNDILDQLYNPNKEDEPTEDDSLVYVNNLFIGDSRMNQMKNYGIVDSSKVIYGGGYGYNWFIGNGTFSASYTNAINGAIEEVKNKVKKDTNYNIIIWLGVNDLAYIDASEYFNKYSELAQNDWSNYNLYIVKVGPVSDDADISNDSIDNFNSSMKDLINGSNLSNIKYIDINYNITTYDSEGLHYGSDDYSNIYNQIIKQVGNNSSMSSRYKIYNLDDYCEFIVVDKTGESNACEAMSISSTSLSKDQFVSKLESYYGNSSASYTTLFKENAGSIYDLAVNNGINPELIVVRASLEGYSPASQGYSSYYNYWGIRCYNNHPLSTCASYNSFQDGVLGFINNVSQYSSLSSMMQKYAYIGSYWYNPGNAGSGGCYYYPYIKKYMSSSRSSEVETACNSANVCSGSNCMKTTDEDQLAYSMWQVEQMANQRNTIFNMTSDFCDGYSQNCTIYAQGDSRWKSISLGKSNTTMGASGCAVTSIAIGISCSGTEITVANFDAGKFIEALNAGSCFTNDGSIYWGCSAITKIAPNVKLLYTESGMKDKSNGYKTEAINKYSVDNNFILVHFKNDSHPRGHYVVVTKLSGNNIIAKDPSGGKVSTISLDVVDQIVVYSA